MSSGHRKTTPGAQPGLRELAELTPRSRNRYADLLRVASIAAVVVGHWMLAVLGWKGGFTGRNLLEIDPSLQILTWLFQVMPVFFIVGGFANGASWESARRRGTSYADWLRTRSVRLLRPALVFVAFWTVLPAIAVVAGLSPGVAHLGGQEVALPLWFLAVYMLAMALVPLLMAAHRRSPVWTLAGLALATAAIDVARYGLEFGMLGAPNFQFVWMAMLELGACWRDGLLTSRRRTPWAMAGGGLVLLALLTRVFNYPVSMIDLSHAPRSNAMPPTLALLALGVAQCGVMLLFEGSANRWLQRARVWLVVVTANSMIMTLYLWNMSAAVLAAVILFPTGLAPQPEALSIGWWLLRPAWVVACAVCLFPFVMAFRRAERLAAASHGGRFGTLTAVTGTVAAAAGLSLLAVHAFPVPKVRSVESAFAIASVVIGALLLRTRVLPVRRRPSS